MSYKNVIPQPIEYESPVLLDIIREQDVDKDNLELKNRIKKDMSIKLKQKKNIIIDDVVYYLSQPDDKPVMRLYILPHQKDVSVRIVP